MSLIKKGANSAFVQSGNIEALSLTGFETVSLRVAVDHLTNYTNLPLRTNILT